MFPSTMHSKNIPRPHVSLTGVVIRRLQFVNISNGRRSHTYLHTHTQSLQLYIPNFNKHICKAECMYVQLFQLTYWLHAQAVTHTVYYQVMWRATTEFHLTIVSPTLEDSSVTERNSLYNTCFQEKSFSTKFSSATLKYKFYCNK